LIKIAILVLAAGGSSRMGRPKQLLDWKGKSLLQHTIDRAKNGNGDEVLVVLGSDYELIKSQINTEGITILKHSNWKNGLGSSIAFGIDYIQKSLSDMDGALIMLADQPFVDTNYLNLMIETFRSNEAKIVASLYPNKKMGVPAIFNKRYFIELAQLNMDKGAKEILSKYSDQLSFLDATSLVVDLDTMEDYQKLNQFNSDNE
jgi:molybdenum cofactor cytidylyltransferase